MAVTNNQPHCSRISRNRLSIEAVDEQARPSITVMFDDKPVATWKQLSTIGVGETSIRVPIQSIEQDDDAITARATLDQWKVSATYRLNDDCVLVDMAWAYQGTEQSQAWFDVCVHTSIDQPDYFMVPGVSYNGNPGKGTLSYPLDNPEGPWSFREERTTVPSCMTLEQEGTVVGFFTEAATCNERISSCCIHRDEGQEGYGLSIRFPYYEGPRSYAGWLHVSTVDKVVSHYYFNTPVSGELCVCPQQTVKRRYYLVVGESEQKRHGYSKVLDAAWKHLDRPVRSWYDHQTRLALALSGMEHNWYEDEQVKGYAVRTSLFGDVRKATFSSPVNSAWCCHNLMLAYYFFIYVLEMGGPARYLDKGMSMIDSFARAARPNGLYPTTYLYPCPYNRSAPARFDTRISADSAGEIYYVMEAIELLKVHGKEYPRAWESFCRNFCNFFVEHQLDSGAFGTIWHLDGHLLHGGKSGGGYIMKTLACASRHFTEPRYLEAAERGAQYYIENCVDREGNYGLAYDQSNIHEWGIAVVLFGLVELYDTTRNERYLHKAVRCAEFLTSLQFTYDIFFDPKTIMGKYGLQTRGGDRVGPQSPATCSWVSFLALDYFRLADFTGDTKWTQRVITAFKQASHLTTNRKIIQDFNFHNSMVGCRPEENFPLVDQIQVTTPPLKKGVPRYANAPVWAPIFAFIQMLYLKRNHPELLPQFDDDVVYPNADELL